MAAFGARMATVLASLAAGLSMVAYPQAPVEPLLPQQLQELRTVRLAPLSTPPSFDWQRLQSGFAFAVAHKKSIEDSWRTSGISAMFASKDIVPVLIADTKYFNDYNRYAQQTFDGMGALIATPKDKSQFVLKNYKAAVSVGLMHLDLSQAVKIKTNPKVRIPGSQQSFAYEVYAFTW